MTETASIRWEQDDTGVVTLVLDDPHQSANTMNRAFRDSLAVVTDRLEAEKDGIRGVILTSAKKTFFADGDLSDLIKVVPETAQDLFDGGMAVKRRLRRIETLGKPVVAAINGAALGCGYQLALACHHRVALDTPGSVIGCPEVTLGLLPGGGGVVRAVRLFGIADALLKVLLQGSRYSPRHARENGLVDDVADNREELIAKARAFIDANPGSSQPWDRPGYRLPGGTPSHPGFAAGLPTFPATLRKQTSGAPYPAPRSILAAAVEGAQVDFETAQVIESRYFVELAVGQTSKNMIQAFFLDRPAVDSGAGRPRGTEPRTARKVAVLGAGPLGAGIAHACASAGIDVVLKDVTPEAAARGRAYCEELCAKAVSRSRTTREAADELLARITPTTEAQDLAGCDTVVEAVFEDTGTAPEHMVFQGIQDVVEPDALLCSGSSAASVTTLAGGADRRGGLIGLRFFPPVDRTPLVEITKDERTGDEALARAFDLVRQLGRTPIVVNDSRGFSHSRVIGRFLYEGVALVGEGIEPASVEQAAAQAGYPAKVLSLMDELTLTLTRRIQDESRRAVEKAGGTWTGHPAEAVVDRMVDVFGRPGRTGGAGFYEYDEDGERAALWPGLREHFTKPGYRIPFRDMQERMLFADALDGVRLLEEGVLTSVADANVGSLLGTGFPGWTGGVLRYVNGYDDGTGRETGPPGFVARARQLAGRYGGRFAPPALLVDKAEKGERFTDTR